jgi:chondroitin AC lyase
LATYDLNTVQILSNTAALQAVQHAKLDIVQAIFYTPGELKFGNKILKANKPCVVMVKQAGTEQPEVLVSDPTQKEIFKVGTDIELIKQ